MNGDNNKHMTLVDLADELTDSHVHIERIPYWDDNRNKKFRVHQVTMPGLLRQMADLFLPSGDPDGGTSAAVSKPPVNWAALADHTVITLAAVKWCWDLRLEQRDTVEGNIRQLVGAAGALDGDTRDKLARDMRRWHTIAETVTEWRTPPMDPRAPCPAYDDTRQRNCETRTLRINLAAQSAYCATCGTTWEGDQVGVLAEAVRTYKKAATEEAEAARIRMRDEQRRREGRHTESAA